MANIKLEHLWDEHLSTSFPRGLGGVEIAGVDLCLLDGDAAGCIGTFLARGGLDPMRRKALDACAKELDVVIPQLSGDARRYFERLKSMTDLVSVTIKEREFAGKAIAVYHSIGFPEDQIAEFCRKNHIRRLSLFGSIIRDDFTPTSDVDVLVEFEPGTRVGLHFFGMERELSELLGRKVDLNTAGFLSKYFRDQVLAEAEPLYDAA